MNVSALLGYVPSVPRNLNYTYEIQHNISNVLFINLTWDTPETTHGSILNYMVEYMTIDASDPVTGDVIAVSTVYTYVRTYTTHIHAYTYHV